MVRRVIALKLVFITVFVSMFCSIGFMTATADDQGLVAYYKFDGNLSDSSGSGNDGTSAGDGITFMKGIKDQSALFNGNTYIEVNDSDTLDLAKSFTLSVWVKTDTIKMVSSHYPILWKKPNSDSKYSDPYYLGLKYYNYFFPEYLFRDTPGLGPDGSKSEVPIDCDKWTLVTMAWDGQELKYYTDGKLISSSDVSVKTFLKTTGKLWIGHYVGDSSNDFYTGQMDELRLYNRTLSDSEIKILYSTVYNGSYIDKLQHKLVAAYNFDGDLKDSSGFGNNGTNVGDGVTFTSGIAGKGGSSDAAKFNGTGYFEVKDSDPLDLDKAFTFTAWVLPDKIEGTSALLFKKKDKDASYEWYTMYGQGPWVPQATYFKDITDTHKSIESSNKAPIAQWNYLTAVYDGSTIKYYINGKLQDTKEFKGLISHSEGNLLIGSGDKYPYKGRMDELKIYNYALTDKDITALYNQRNTLSATVVKTMKAGQSQNIKIGFKPLRANAIDITGKAIVSIGVKSAKLLKYSKGKLTASGKGNASFTVKYQNLSATYTISIQ